MASTRLKMDAAAHVVSASVRTAIPAEHGDRRSDRDSARSVEGTSRVVQIEYQRARASRTCEAGDLSGTERTLRPPVGRALTASAQSNAYAVVKVSRNDALRRRALNLTSGSARSRRHEAHP